MQPTLKYYEAVGVLCCTNKLRHLHTTIAAQWALESGWGSSKLATLHYNFAGIKYREYLLKKGSYKSPEMPMTGVRDVPFMGYKSTEEWVRGYEFKLDHSYPDWRHANSGPDFLDILLRGGYAEDVNYKRKVLTVRGSLSDLAI